MLGASTLFTIASFGVAFRTFHKRAGSRSYWETFRRSEDPTIFTLVLEDLADLTGLALAFTGVYLGHRLNNPYLDGAVSIAIGGVMAVAAGLLARESKGLLVGESATPDERAAIRAAAANDPDVEDVQRSNDSDRRCAAVKPRDIDTRPIANTSAGVSATGLRNCVRT